MDIRRIGSIKDGEQVIGNRTKVKVVKNKVAPPFKDAEFDIIYGEGISNHGELIDLGVTLNLVDKAGTWFTFGKERLGQGRDNARKYLKDNPDISARLETAVREAYGLCPVEPDKSLPPAPPLDESVKKKLKAVGGKD